MPPWGVLRAGPLPTAAALWRGAPLALAPRQPPPGGCLLGVSPLKATLKPKAPLRSFLCYLLGWGCCHAIYDRKPVVKHASDKRKLTPC